MDSKYITLALIAAICVSLGGTLITLNKLSEVQELKYITGFAISDTGTGTLIISSDVSIEVNATSGVHDTIDFGTCTPFGGQSIAIESNYSGGADLNDYGNCSESFPEYIQVVNIGNEDANITITSSLAATAFVGDGSGELFQYITADGDELAGIDHRGGCDDCGKGNCGAAYDTVDTWTEITAAEQRACANLTFVPGAQSTFKTFLRIVIPSDTPAHAQTTATLTYDASSISP